MESTDVNCLDHPGDEHHRRYLVKQRQQHRLPGTTRTEKKKETHPIYVTSIAAASTNCAVIIFTFCQIPKRYLYVHSSNEIVVYFVKYGKLGDRRLIVLCSLQRDSTIYKSF